MGSSKEEGIKMTDQNPSGLKIGETPMQSINMVDRTIELRVKYNEAREWINKVFLHEPYYKDLAMAALASRAKLALEGMRGCGKSYLMDSIKRLITERREEPFHVKDKNGKDIAVLEVGSKIVWRVQGYLDADIEDTMVRPDLPGLMRGEENLIWKPAVNARVKMFDEIQRLGVKALSVMFGMMDSGKVFYLEQESGVYPFWSIFTMNPTETAEDNMNFAIPEPLIDRFDAMMWVPRAKSQYEAKIKTQSEMKELQDSIPQLFNEQDLLDLWKEVERIPIPDEQAKVINLACRIISFCLYAQSYDATSLTIAKKRALCSACQANYFCHQIARPPSIRAKQSWMQLCKGFAYLRGHKEVTIQDLADSFPAVFWRRIALMDEDNTEKPENADRLHLFTELWSNMLKEQGEAKQFIQMTEDMKKVYNEDKYKQLEKWSNTHAWPKESLDYLKEYWEEKNGKMVAKMDEAKKKNDMESAILIWAASKGLPPDVSSISDLPFEMKINLDPAWLTDLATISSDTFEELNKLRKDSGMVQVVGGKLLETLIKLKMANQIKLEGEVIWDDS